MGGNPFILAASARHGFKTLADLVDYGRANPGALNVGHAGTGGLTHLSALLFLTRANVQATMVPYRGGAQALSDVLAGQIDLYSASVSEVIPTRPPASYRCWRCPTPHGWLQLPALPTIAETYPGYAVETWNGLVGPAGMPEAVLARLADEGRDIVADPAFRARLEELGITPYGEPPSAFGARIKAERNLWQPLLAAAGIEPQ